MAEALCDWLPCVIQACDPWISSSDIEAGIRWGPRLAEELQQTSFGILCLTPENLTAPWILFEAGALSKIVNGSNVCPLLLDVHPTDIIGPLAQFQSVKADKEGLWKLIKTINSSLGDVAIDESVIQKVFEYLWLDLESSIKSIPTNTKDAISAKRSPEDMLEELLEIAREQSRMFSRISPHDMSFIPSGIEIDSLIRKIFKGARGERIKMILASIRAHEGITTNELQSELKDDIPITTLYHNIEGLLRMGLIVESSDRPKKFSLSPRLLENMIANL